MTLFWALPWGFCVVGCRQAGEDGLGHDPSAIEVHPGELQAEQAFLEEARTGVPGHHPRHERRGEIALRELLQHAERGLALGDLGALFDQRDQRIERHRTERADGLGDDLGLVALRVRGEQLVETAHVAEVAERVGAELGLGQPPSCEFRR